MLSPRRTKPDSVTVMYELRSLRAQKPLAIMRSIESRIRKWRGMVRWTLIAFASHRGEAVVHIVGERHSQVSRRDNLFTSWQRLVKLIGVVDVGRAAWVSAGNGAAFFADARILHESYESAVAKVLDDATKIDASVLTCTDVLPLLPPVVPHVVNAGVIAGATGSSSTCSSGQPPATKIIALQTKS